MIVFFDDILVYSSCESEPVLHLQAVFEILKRNDLLVKLSKCRFGQHQVGFLGQIISGGGIQPYPIIVLN